jgi:hypothetical protein
MPRHGEDPHGSRSRSPSTLLQASQCPRPAQRKRKASTAVALVPGSALPKLPPHSLNTGAARVTRLTPVTVTSVPCFPGITFGCTILSSCITSTLFLYSYLDVSLRKLLLPCIQKSWGRLFDVLMATTTMPTRTKGAAWIRPVQSI